MTTSCTIIISHFESLPFLRACIRQIRKYANSEVMQHIIIADQSGEAQHTTLLAEFWGDEDINIVWTKPLYSGFGIDYIMRNIPIKTDYICQLHVDAFPVHKNWLYLPIQLLKDHYLSFVGQLQFIADGTASIYPPDKFFAMAQCYNVAKTKTYRELSMAAGFTRYHNRPQAGMEWGSGDWAEWAKKDYNSRGSDDDIVAFHWEDTHREHDKLGLAITGFVEPSWGRIIEDVVFHFCSCREAIGVSDSMPKLYREYTKKINEDYSDTLIEEMINLAKANRPPEMQILTRNFWDGKTKESKHITNELHKRIEELKT